MNPSTAIDYETIFLQAPVGMCISEHRVIQNANDTLAAMFGYTRAQLQGLSFLALYPTMDEFLRTGDRIMADMILQPADDPTGKELLAGQWQTGIFYSPANYIRYFSSSRVLKIIKYEKELQALRQS